MKSRPKILLILFYYFTIFRLSIVVRCGNNDDSITMKGQEGTDTLNFIFESPSKSHPLLI